MNTQKRQRFHRSTLFATVVISLLPSFAMAVPSLAISQFPLELAIPTHPQVIFAIGNSESMDGTLSGAIMVGSGSLAASLSTLQNSSSPVSYTVPAGFTPPIQAADGSGLAPYTVNQSGTLYDNGPSRLNVAKAGIIAILNAYMQNTDFALQTYNTSSLGKYTTWLYLMSPAGANFTFTNTQLAGNRYVPNPCYGYTTGSSTVLSNCTSMTGFYSSATLSTNQYMQIGSSSDDPNINDVLYAGSGIPGVLLTYTTTGIPSPATPYPPNFTLTNYNNQGILITYSKSLPNIGGFATGPTNAGYVPYSPQVLYAERGFGYYANQSANIGKTIVPMTTAGTNPTTASVTTAINTFLPYLNPETNNSSSTEIKSSAVQGPTAGMLTTSKSYLATLPVAACPAKQYVVLISDGLPTEDLNGSMWPPLGTASSSGYGETATFNADGSLNTTNDQALKDTITALTNLWSSKIKTYVIGLGAGVDPTQNPQAAATLTAMAVAGNSINYYPATSPAALVADLNSILIALQNEALTTTAATVNSTHLQAGDVEFQTSFNGNDTPYQDWTGNLIKKALSTTTGFPVGTAIWSAQTLLDAQSTRLITTWDPTLNGGVGRGIPFLWANLNSTQTAQLQPSDALGASRLLYLRGSSALEKRNGGTFRNRTHLLGDIVESKPLYVGPPSSPTLLFSSTSYVAYVLANANRTPMLYVGANDGMMHAFVVSTGAEQFAFVPNGVFSNLFQLTAPLFNQNHLYFVNGSPVSSDVQFSDGTWHTILVGGENGGGKSIYALDVTNPATFTSETLVSNAIRWEFSDADMGLSYSQPQVAQISSNSSTLKFAVFFGNGYNSPTNKTILYAINPQNGQTLAKIDLCAAVAGSCNAALPQGLSTVAFGQSDGLEGQPITQVYAGDLQGNLWAVDVVNTNPLTWQVRLLFQARDASAVPQPITTPPQVTLNPSYPRLPGLFVMFGTGQFLTNGDLSNTQTQSIYGVWDRPTSAGVVLHRANLQAQTLTLVLAGTSGLPQDILLDTSLAVNWGTNYGWYTDLPIPGQRVITVPLLINGSFITTLNTPPATPCGMASSMFLDINYITGGAFPLPQLDINASGTITSSDQYTGLNPVGLGLLPGYVSAPIILPSTLSNTDLLANMSSGQQLPIITPNNNGRQTAWWQLQ
ncbi:MAG: PilC/PilY family type IV pilus protein [Legionellales bacterium]|nr:PilC/PilY family type IV pilus protein [Legionellales bacterium]